MKKANSLDVKDLTGMSEGWRVQIYDRDRRLICLLEPSHGWIFMLGCLMGFMIAAIGFSRTAPPPSLPAHLPAGNAPLQLE